MIVERTYGHTIETSSLALFAGAVFYSFQIYCDFSGYSDIALGAARVMNIKLMENFKQPYLATGMADFWSRWHISLSSWFRDYLYIPMGGNRKGEWRRKFNVLVVFLLSGLWHGANWTFVIWGLLHGLLVIILTRKLPARTKGKLYKAASVVVTFVLVTFLWIFFRSENIHVACDYIRQIFAFRTGSNYIGLNRAEIAFAVLMIAVMMYREKYMPAFLISNNKVFYLFVAFMVIVCYYLGVFVENQFIYFQF
jgi:D-alanyl-lipoteichoic acid acyltransferase DltB (MBOAT superfamily)